MKSLPVAWAVLLAVAATPAPAQRFPGRDRGESPREMRRSDSPRAERSVLPADPFAALEREMPSLKVDLMLKAEQLPAWQLFERDVRGLAEMGRVRTRYLMALRDPGDKAPPGAGEMLDRLADEDRRKSGASTELKRHFDALYTLLDEGQRRAIDRRVVLSQTEPLGQEVPPRR